MSEIRGRLSPAPDVVSRRLGEAAILIDLETARMFALNDTATVIWECIRDGGPLLEQVRACFDEPDRVPPGQMAADVAKLIEELEGLGLVGVSAMSDRDDMSPLPYPVPRPRVAEWSRPSVVPIGTVAEALPRGGLPMPGLRSSD